MHFKRIYILLLLDGMLYKCQLSSTVLLSLKACVSFPLLPLAGPHADVRVSLSPSFAPVTSVAFALCVEVIPCWAPVYL